MRYLIFGDTHIPVAPRFFEHRLTELCAIVQQYKCTKAIQLGDLFDLYHMTNDHIDLFMQMVVRLRKAGIEQFHIIQGNHEIPKHTGIAPISQILDRFGEAGFCIESVSTPRYIDDIFYAVPYCTTLPEIPHGAMIVSHLDPPLVKQIQAQCNPVGLFNGHNHTPRKYGENIYDVGSLFPIEFDKKYKDKNYYVVGKGHRFKLRPFPQQIAQRIVEINSAKDLSELERNSEFSLVKTIIKTKEIGRKQIKRMRDEGHIAQIAFDYKYELSIENELQEIQELFSENAELLRSIDFKLYAQISDTLNTLVQKGE